MFWKRFRDYQGSVVFRLTTAYAVVGLVLNVVGLGATYYIVSTYTLHSIDDELMQLWEELGTIAREHGQDAVSEEFGREVSFRGSSKVFFRILDAHDSPLQSSDLAAWTGINTAGAATQRAWGTPPSLSTLSGNSRNAPARILSGPLTPAYAIEIGFSLEEPMAMLDRLLVVFSTFGALMIICGTALGWVIARRAMSGIRAVTLATARVAERHFGARVSTTGGGREIDMLADSFNIMAAQIETLMNEMRETNDNIAHDLRSPVARMRVAAESALLSKEATEQTVDVAGEIVDECDRLIEMINTMLDISEVKSGVARMEDNAVDLAELARSGVELFQPVAQDRKIRMECSAFPTLAIRGDKRKLQRLLANLLDNAIKYTPENGVISVTMVSDDHEVRLAVRDTGIGISEQDLLRIFHRFFRGDSSRSALGNGLGLSLARAIARAHGGDISVESVLGSGSLFTLKLPLPVASKNE